MHLTTHQFNIGEPFIEFTTIESTNNYAMGLVKQGVATHGMAVFAHAQTKGKGQRGKLWSTQPDKNIILSLLLDASHLNISKQFELIATIAVATHEFLNTYILDNTTIKWSNDLYWRDRKAGGILIENVINGMNWQWSIVGIGININQTEFDETAKNPVSLKQITGKEFNPVALAKELCSYIQIKYTELLQGDFAQILHQYNQALYKKNESVTLKKDARVFSATVKQVNEWGQLKIDNAAETVLNFGEVEWIIK